VHAFVNELERPVGTYLYGRRMYETMVYWDRQPDPNAHPFVKEYAAIWQAAEKVVYSKTLQKAAGARTRLERTFDPAAVRQRKAEATGDISVGGADLAAQAIEAGLVDDYQLFVVPVVVGTGKPAFPKSGGRVNLELLDERRFGDGTVFLHYRARQERV